MESLSEGVWLPILPVDSIEYIIKVDKSFDAGWVEVFSYEGFNIKVGDDNSFWIGSFGNLLKWSPHEYSNETDHHSYETLDDEVLYKAFRFNKERGKYSVKISGYKRINELEFPESNYGYLFSFERVEDFEGYKDPREDDKFSFNLPELS